MASKRKVQCKWTDAEVTAMIEILQDASDSSTCENGFKTSTWQQVADTLDDVLKTRSTCFSKFRRLKAEYKEVKYLCDKSGFGWDCERDLPTTTDDVWAPVLQGRPELRKWKHTPFPWFEQMQSMFGNSLAVGKHSFRPGQQSANEQLSDNEDDFIPASAIASTPSDDNTPQNTPQSQDTIGTPDIISAKRECESAEPQMPKRRKVTGVAVMQEMSDGLRAIADAMRENTAAMSLPAKEDVQSTVEGQAQTQVQDEAYLTEAGLLVMLDILADETMARTYLVMRKPAMRKSWIRLQLQTYNETHTGILWDWFVDDIDYAL